MINLNSVQCKYKKRHKEKSSHFLCCDVEHIFYIAFYTITSIRLQRLWLSADSNVFLFSL